MVRDANKEYEKQLTFGQRLADDIAAFGGSWSFILLFFAILIMWMTVNSLVLIRHWDPYPFILLNLVLSCLAAIQAPIILMSQNRQADRDRIQADLDYEVNVRAENEVNDMQRDLDEIKHMIAELAAASTQWDEPGGKS